MKKVWKPNYIEVEKWYRSSFEPYDVGDRKLHWFIRFYLWLHKKLVIDRIKIDRKDIKIFP